MTFFEGLSRALALAALSFLAAIGNNGSGGVAGGGSRAVEPRIEAYATAETGPCVVDAQTLCLNGGRFRVQVTWKVPNQGTSGVGTGVSLTSDTGYFWFFSSNNIELILKVVDGRSFNGMYWVFYGALSNVEYTITVTDTVSGNVKVYTNPFGNLASVADTSAFSGSLRSDPGEESRAEAPAEPGDTAPAAESRPVTVRLGHDEAAAAACTPDATTLCLNNGRFKVSVAWRVPAQGTSGAGQAIAVTGDTGYFWFFSANNIELVIKALDGTPVNGQYWVFYGALSNVEYTITVTDTQTGYFKTFFNPSGNLASVADTSGFSAQVTPTPVAATPTPTPTQSGGKTWIVNVGAGNTNTFRDPVTNSSSTTIKVGDTVQWVFQGTNSYHSTTSGTCSNGGDPYGGYYSCNPDGNWDSGQMIGPNSTYSKTFTAPGSFPYFCSVHQQMMTGLLTVNPQ